MKQVLRRDVGVRRIVREWRALTGGPRVRDADRRTLIACSGGVDSSALVLALAAASENLVVAHAVHDMRSREESLADRDATKMLAERLGLVFVEASVTTKGTRGNVEAIARRRRYAELVRLVGEKECVAIATAHHADDQLETVLMRLMRGAGMRGMSGVATVRALGGVRLVRPMLCVGRCDAVRICRVAEWNWREDVTNADTRLLRALIRHEVVPVMRGKSASVARRAVEFARMAGEAAQLARAGAMSVLNDAKDDGHGLAWDRSALRAEPAIVLGELLHIVRERWCGERGRDRVRWSSVERVHAAINDAGEHRRTLRVAGLEVVVEARRVLVRRTE